MGLSELNRARNIKRAEEVQKSIDIYTASLTDTSHVGLITRIVRLEKRVKLLDEVIEEMLVEERRKEAKEARIQYGKNSKH